VVAKKRSVFETFFSIATYTILQYLKTYFEKEAQTKAAESRQILPLHLLLEASGFVQPVTARFISPGA
jgi:hypothetical protein